MPMLTLEEVIQRVDRLTEYETDCFLKQVGVRPKCTCPKCKQTWMVRVNEFLRVVEASRN